MSAAAPPTTPPPPPVDPEAGALVTVPLDQVERELDRQLKSAQGPGEAPVVRARMSNQIVYCNDPARADELAAVIPEIVSVHPSRVLLVVDDRDGPSDTLSASVWTRVHRVGTGLRAFSEMIVLRADGPGCRHLPFAVRSLLIGDLPTNVWWTPYSPPSMAGAILYDLAERADQVIYDSYGWPEPARGIAATATWLRQFERTREQGGYRVASDLTWRRMKTWRRLVAQALEPVYASGGIESVSEVTMDHGPHSVSAAWTLASWLSLRLGWKVAAAHVTPGVEIAWRFESPKGERLIRVRRQAEAPRGVQQIRIACAIDGKPATLVLSQADPKRLQIEVEGDGTPPSTITIAQQSVAELLGRQLSDRERDPVFLESMAVAQQLAQSVIG